MLCKPELEEWSALFVVTGEEDRVKERLQYRFEEKFRIMVPKRKLRERKYGIWSDSIRVLFPGYVLLCGDIGPEEYYQLKYIPGVLKLLSSGCEPLKIERSEMEILSRLVCNNEIIGFSDVLIEGRKIVVADGPLLSMEGLIMSINHRKGRAKVRLNFLGEERTIELGISILQPADEGI